MLYEVITLGGEALYRDFFEFLPPGSFLLVAAWMKVAGTGFAAVRLLQWSSMCPKGWQCDTA